MKINSIKRVVPKPYAIVSGGGMNYRVTYDDHGNFVVFKDYLSNSDFASRMNDWEDGYDDILNAGKNCLIFNKEL